ncbi:MAG: hypothetical protein ACE5G8_04590, partial [Anaerolineae bacterium]
MAYLPLLLLAAAALFSGATALLIVIAVRSSREHRNTIFPIVREVEGIKARRAVIAASVCLVLAVTTLGGWIATQQNPANVLVARTITAAPATGQRSPATPAAETPRPPAETPSPADSPPAIGATARVAGSTTIVTPPPTATPPAPLSPPAATATATPALPTRTPSPVPIPDGIRIGPVAFAAQITDDRQPVDPANVFDLDTGTVYAVFPYSGMKNGLPFAAIWYHQGREIIRDEYEWEWGVTDRSFVFIKPVGPG